MSKLIAELQTQVRYGGHFEIGASDTGHRHVEALIQVELMDCFTQRVALGDNDAPIGDAASLQDKVVVAASPTTRSNCSSAAEVPTTRMRSLRWMRSHRSPRRFRFHCAHARS